jgi:hypothetical protein
VPWHSGHHREDSRNLQDLSGILVNTDYNNRHSCELIYPKARVKTDFLICCYKLQ